LERFSSLWDTLYGGFIVRDFNDTASGSLPSLRDTLYGGALLCVTSSILPLERIPPLRDTLNVAAISYIKIYLHKSFFVLTDLHHQ